MDEVESVAGGVRCLAGGARRFEEEATADCTGISRRAEPQGREGGRERDHLFGGLYGSRSCFEKALTLSAPRTS